ncbi:MAG: hypothetical protein HQK50_18665 [Oligoflexia bacterium]|nr:hypothetical protein [Oligoflexia bacterium]
MIILSAFIPQTTIVQPLTTGGNLAGVVLLLSDSDSEKLTSAQMQALSCKHSHLSEIAFIEITPSYDLIQKFMLMHRLTLFESAVMPASCRRNRNLCYD